MAGPRAFGDAPMITRRGLFGSLLGAFGIGLASAMGRRPGVVKPVDDWGWELVSAPVEAIDDPLFLGYSKSFFCKIDVPLIHREQRGSMQYWDGQAWVDFAS